MSSIFEWGSLAVDPQAPIEDASSSGGTTLVGGQSGEPAVTFDSRPPPERPVYSFLPLGERNIEQSDESSRDFLYFIRDSPLLKTEVFLPAAACLIGAVVPCFSYNTYRNTDTIFFTILLMFICLRQFSWVYIYNRFIQLFDMYCTMIRNSDPLDKVEFVAVGLE